MNMESLYCIKKNIVYWGYNTFLEIRGGVIKNKDYTIICNNCMAGFIYHRLHMRFLSPTINLWIGDTVDDYIRLLLNLKDYMDMDLKFIHDGVDKYPRAWLGDVKIGFNHYSDEIDAKETWEKRKKRIDWNNIYVIVYSRNGISKADYERLIRCGYKKIAVVGDRNAKKFITDGLRFRNEHDEWLTKINGIRIFERDFDYVSFLRD